MAGRYPPHPEEVKQAVIEADKQGIPRKEISAQYGVSDWAIRQWAGIKRHSHNAKAAERRIKLRQEAKDLHNAGHTYISIAKELGIPASTAWDYVNKVYDERLEPLV